MGEELTHGFPPFLASRTSPFCQGLRTALESWTTGNPFRGQVGQLRVVGDASSSKAAAPDQVENPNGRVKLPHRQAGGQLVVGFVATSLGAPVATTGRMQSIRERDLSWVGTCDSDLGQCAVMANTGSEPKLDNGQAKRAGPYLLFGRRSYEPVEPRSLHGWKAIHGSPSPAGNE